VKDVVASYEMLVNIFERIQLFLQRLSCYANINVRLTTAMTELLGKIMAHVITILALSTRAMKERRKRGSTDLIYCLFAHYGKDTILKRLVGRTDIEDALQRLDTLTNEEGQMTTARNLEVTHHVDGNVATIKEVIQDVDGNVKVMKELASEVDGNVKAIKELTRDVDGNVVAIKEVIHDVDSNIKAATELTHVVNSNVMTIKEVIDDVDSNIKVAKEHTHNVDSNVVTIKEVIHDIDSNLRATKELTYKVGDDIKAIEGIIRNIDDNLKATKHGTHYSSRTSSASTDSFPVLRENSDR